MRLAIAIGLLAALLAVPAHAQEQTGTPRVLAIDFANDVNPVTADYVTGEIDRANREGYDAVVILLDTPGGLLDSTREIYQSQLASDIPVITYVSPDGARAASAGAWIGQASDVLAMAPQTNIGSSTPISSGGEDIPKDLRKKAINDAAASLRALTEQHGRNVDWADRAVREASNLTAEEALEQNVIDAVAPSLPALLDQLEGFKTTPKGFVLHLSGAEINEVEMSFWKQILDTIIDPNLITIFFAIGVLGIIIEMYNPGAIFPGAIGAVSLILGLFGLSVLPVNWAGLLLMALAVGFFVAEIFVTSYGALSVAGIVSFFFGTLLLFDPAGPVYEISLPFAIGVAAAFGLMMAFVVTKLVQAERNPVAVGAHRLVGTHGEVRANGLVFVGGELWRASSPEGELSPGDHVTVTAVDQSGLELIVQADGDHLPDAGSSATT